MKLDGVEYFNLTHADSWGESCSVNNFKQETNEDGYITVQLEMQSGDIISVRATSILIDSEK